MPLKQQLFLFEPPYRLAWCLNSVLNVKAVVAAFNQEKALVGAFSVITNLRIELFEAVVSLCDLVLCRDADQRLVLVAGRTGAHTITCTPAQLHYTPATRGITIQVTHVSHVAWCDT